MTAKDTGSLIFLERRIDPRPAFRSHFLQRPGRKSDRLARIIQAGVAGKTIIQG